MRFQTLLLIPLIVLAMQIAVPKAEAVDASTLSRIDAIIKEITALRAEFAVLTTPTTPTGSVLGASSAKIFTQSLAVGETNSDIEKIQKLLATDPSIYPYGVSSGFFGPKTQEGIKNFQTRFNLAPVGVVGPATKALLELFLTAYPDGTYPADVLKKKPVVLGASVSVPTPTIPFVVPNVNNTGNIEEITAKYNGEEARVKVSYDNDTTASFMLAGNTKIKIVDLLATKLGKTRAVILALIEFSNSNSGDYEDEDDFNVDVEIDDDETTVTFEYDGDDYKVTVDSTDEDDVLDAVADELDEDLEDVDEDLIEAIEDALDEALDEADDNDGDEDEIESITARIANGEAEIEVEYGDGEEDDFIVEETLESKIIKEIADELNIDEDEVEDLIKFKYEDIDEIIVEIKNNKALVFVKFEDGTVKRIRINSKDEDEIIAELADELSEDEDDIEDWTEFDYRD